MKLSSKIKFSQNLKRYEDDDSSATSLVCTALIGFSHIHWCGLLFYPYRRQCEKPDFRIKQYSSHTFFVYPLSSGNWGAITQTIMWIWILVIFAVGGAILGALSNEKDGALGGCLTGLFTGGSCLTQIFIWGLSILFVLWLFGALFG